MFFDGISRFPYFLFGLEEFRVSTLPPLFSRTGTWLLALKLSLSFLPPLLCDPCVMLC